MLQSTAYYTLVEILIKIDAVFLKKEQKSKCIRKNSYFDKQTLRLNSWKESDLSSYFEWQKLTVVLHVDT